MTDTREFLQAATMTRTEAGNRLIMSRLTDEQRVLIEDLLIMYDQMVERLGETDEFEDARELEEIVRLGAKMRTAQKAYFRTRASEKLEESKRLEREFDARATKKLDEAEVTVVKGYGEMPTLFPA